MKKNNQHRGNSAASAEKTAQTLASSPDFERNICVVLRDRTTGKEIFRSAPLFSAVEAERMGDQGIEEYIETGMMPADGVEYPGVKWDAQGFFWSPESSKPKAKVRQELGV